MRATWLASVLRGAGLKVVEYEGWRTRGEDFEDLWALVWHHDASAPGDSPNLPGYMLREMAAGRPGAQLWVDRYGVWHILAAGVAFHAGRTLPGMPGNRQSLGVETDHTTGEPWPVAQLGSLRSGTAAILAHLEKPAKTGLHFHKTICKPAGRKSDPDGLNLLIERAHVQSLIAPPRATAPVATVKPPLEDDMPEPLLLLVTQRTGPQKGNYLFDLARVTKRRVNVGEYAAYVRLGVESLDNEVKSEAAEVAGLIASPHYRLVAAA